MDLKRLRTFVAVADLGTVSKAALRLRISQSALSRHISDLEHAWLLTSATDKCTLVSRLTA